MFSINRLFIASLIATSFVLAGCSGSPPDTSDVRVTTESSTSPKCRLAIEKTFEAENRTMTPGCDVPGSGGGGGGGGGGGTIPDAGGAPSITPGDDSADLSINQAQGWVACLTACSNSLNECKASPYPYSGYACAFTKASGTYLPLPPSMYENTGACLLQWYAQCHDDYAKCSTLCQRQLMF